MVRGSKAGSRRWPENVKAGVTAGLVSMVGFGLDSGIESVSAVLVGLRLSARLRHG